VDLPAGVVRDIESSMKPDRYRTLRGPFSPASDSLMEELHRIDSRLVVRWDPRYYRYAVWLKLPATGRLWPQPVMRLVREDGSPRKLNRRDLYLIRREAYLSRRSGWQRKIRDLDRGLASMERAGTEAVAKERYERCERFCRQNDIRPWDLGLGRLSRGAIFSGVPERRRV